MVWGPSEAHFGLEDVLPGKRLQSCHRQTWEIAKFVGSLNQIKINTQTALRFGNVVRDILLVVRTCLAVSGTSADVRLVFIQRPSFLSWQALVHYLMPGFTSHDLLAHVKTAAKRLTGSGPSPPLNICQVSKALALFSSL
jgi:hypothetical protein